MIEFGKILPSLLDLLYPRTCEVCEKVLSLEERHICHECMEDIPLTYYWSWKENPAEKILWGRTRFERVVSLFFYKRESNYKNLIHRIKYHSDRRLGLFLGEMLGTMLRDSPCGEGNFAQEIDFVVPVPLHWFKKWKRGYNQAEVIALGVEKGVWGENGKRVVKDVLVRKKFTPSQTKISMGSKWQNVENAFALNNFQLFEGKHILLVDDVLTSGATGEACWDVLKNIPNIKVSLCTLAYVE